MSLDWLIEWDRNAFLLLNNEWVNPALDAILPLWREKLFWAPVYLYLLVYLWIWHQQKTVYFLAMLILLIAASDQLSSHLIKPLVGRLRPCNDPDFADQVRLLVRCGSGLSFTSSHAANHFALSTFLALFFRRHIGGVLLFYFWAGSIAYAQVYVGVHYPLDVFAGAILGILLGSLFYTWGNSVLKFSSWDD